MCSMVDYEMLVSHSPPVYSHSPPSGFLSDYNPYRFTSDPFSKVPRASCRASPPTTLSLNTSRSTPKMPASPKRPCLVIRPDDPLSSSDEDPTSPTRLKKKVVFADDKGMSLTHVRVMTEPSNVPPLWSLRFLAEVTHGISAEPEALEEPWEITFPQPASDYVEFRKRLDTGKVSLENVIVKESEDVIVGTVKVSNIAFHKEVFVRSTSNKWKTSEDAFCNYVPNSVPTNVVNPAYVLYDTFSFKIPVPPRAQRIEFCVCFKCEGQEYWDSNGGKNYVLMKKITPPMHKSFSADDIYKRNGETDHKPVLRASSNGITQAKLDSWSEFASWTHLENSNPYCLV